jgi:hypothetical protein
MWPVGALLAVPCIVFAGRRWPEQYLELMHKNGQSIAELFSSPRDRH